MNKSAKKGTSFYLILCNVHREFYLSEKKRNVRVTVIVNYGTWKKEWFFR